MAKKNEIQIIITAVDKATKELTGIGNSLGSLGKVALGAGVAVAGIVAGIGIAAFKLAKDAAEVEKTRNTWNNLAISLGESGGNIESLREATRGMVNDADLMFSASKLMSMGLAKSNDEAARLLEISTQLGSAMGVDATTAAEDFALMLANQSIPRLDTFGISSGKVRQRIEELMEADKNLTREQAFLTATLEEAEKTLAKVGEQGTGAAGDMARLQANMDNLKSQIGERFLPVLATISEKLVGAWNDPRIQAGIQNVLDWLGKVIGDENSGIVGVITRLFEGDIAGAFDTAFGAGTWTKIQTFIANFKIALDGLIKVVEGVISVLEFLIDLFDETKARAAGTGYERMMGIAPANKKVAGLASLGFASGGSFIVPGVGTGDRPYTMGLEPGERVAVTPRGRLSGGEIPSLTIIINTPVNLADRSFVERELAPIVRSTVRQVLAGA